MTSILTYTTLLGSFSRPQVDNVFLIFSQKISIEISCSWLALVAELDRHPTDDQEIAGSVSSSNILSMEIGHEIYSKVIISLLLNQERQLSVSGIRLGTSTG